MKTYKDLTPEIQVILTAKQKKLINQGLQSHKPFLICGQQGPTGKTTLATALKKLGATVYEPFEMVHIKLNTVLGE